MAVGIESPAIALVPIAAIASPTAIRDDMEKSNGRYEGGDVQGAGRIGSGAWKKPVVRSAVP